ncbi:Wzz/FepE/Etk N-terminal domain-containing protein [Algibacillus agarilyticus]|uniref:Wzz/FepE/Etk N-terminal domain-containing protein n=1 Tax=Algibacillus agarilyticus TaxID=2234133 RepID=UPI000DCFCFB5|nr:Wzz/FepE/Etk N-terminal domain-containing protein [Algibacillus agarilyticus]
MKIESKLNEPKIDPKCFEASDDIINISQLWYVIWLNKVKIIVTTSIFSLLAIVYVLSLPDIYKSSITLAPTKSDGGSLGGLASQYGGLAAMAGINLGGQSNDVEQAIELLESWPFIDNFVKKHDIKADIMAVDKWDKVSGKLIYDEDLYNSATGKWVVKSGETEDLSPSSYKTFRKISKMIFVSLDNKTNLLNIDVEHYSPLVAKKWAIWLANDINKHFQDRDIEETAKNIDYLKNKVLETNITDMQSVFYNMIESQTKVLMLAEVSKEYLLKTVVPPMAPEEKSKPKRGLKVIFITLLGGLMSVAFFIMRHFLKKRN